MQFHQPLLNKLATSDLPLTSQAVDQAQLSGGLHLNPSIGHAVEHNRRADFALLLAMFSSDVRQTTPVEPLELTQPADNADTIDRDLRQQFGVANPQQLKADSASYLQGARISEQFHTGGIQSAKLCESLKPDALGYMPEKTHGLGEDVYRNLSHHDKNALTQAKQQPTTTHNLYQKLLVASRTEQIQAQA